MMTLDKKQLERYSRMLALHDFSVEDQETLLETTITVVGAGGLGSPVLRMLAALGVGRLRIIDHDVVELSNLQRQTLYNIVDIGRPKAEAAAENLAKMNPDIELEPILASINERDAVSLLKGSDIILDGLDTIHARRAVNKASVSLRVPYVYAGAIEYYGNVSTFIPGKTGCLQCLVGDAVDDLARTCSTVGVTPVVLNVVASIEVQEAILLATRKRAHLAGKIMHVDMRTLTFETFDIQKSDACPVCSNEQEEALTMSDEIQVNALCTNSFNITPPTILDLDLEAIGERLKEEKYKVRISKLFLSAQIREDVMVTVMKKGTAVVKGVTDPDEALRLYRLVVDGAT